MRERKVEEGRQEDARPESGRSHRFADRPENLIQGSVEKNFLVGGLMSPDDDCAWVLELAKQE